MRIAGAALNQTPLDWSNNTTNITNAIKMAKKVNISVLCLPELCITGYGCEDLFLFPWVEQRAIDELFKILPHTENITATLGLPIWYENNVYNSICLVSNGKILGFQAKKQLPNYGVHYEQRWFKPWVAKQQTISIKNNSYQFGDYTYKIDGTRIGFEICEEAWNIDRPANQLADQKVDIILNPSASHFALNKEGQREKLVINSSKEFDCIYVYTNLLGNEAGRIIYDGDVIIAKNGILLASGERFSKQNVNLVSTNVGNTDLANANILSANDQFTKAATLGLFDYLRKSKGKGFVLSLSGGADSSSILVLVVQMVKTGIEELGITSFLEKINREDLIGKVSNENEITKHILITAYQGSKNSSNETLTSAKTLAVSVGATFYHWPIDQQIETAIATIEDKLERKLTWSKDDIALQNIQARSRSPLIWMLANISNSILLTTSNRSEGSVGYTTMDGDSSGSLAPIAGIDKSFLLAWLKWAEVELNFNALSFVNQLTPTAELRPLQSTQSDEDDLMPYSVLQQIEELFIKERKSPYTIYQELSGNSSNPLLARRIIKFFNLWSRNQWKRERIAPSFHLDDYNIDPRSWFRFPILSGGFLSELNELQQIVDCA